MTATRQRLIVVAAVLIATALKLWLAATTNGTNDVGNFHVFADGVRHFGPIDIYGQHLTIAAPYNHPPLTGWMLVLINWFADQGVPFRLLIRLPATIADVVSTVLIFQLIKVRRPAVEATIGATVFALSPVLIAISGFHGNTDPVFAMFALLSLFLLTTRQSTVTAALAGISFTASISIKLVPIVVLPVLLLVAARSGTRRLVAFLAASGAFMALLWGPVVLRRWEPFKQNVLEYAGYGGRARWGLPEFGYAAGWSKHTLDVLEGPGRFVMLLLSAGIPLIIAWRRPRAAVPAFGLALASFLVLTTTFATQYLVWAVAATFLINVWSGVAYTVSAGALLVKVYDRWNHAYLWDWNNGRAAGMSHRETMMAGVVWLILLVGSVAGLRWSSSGRATDTAPDAEPAVRAEEDRPANVAVPVAGV